MRKASASFAGPEIQGKALGVVGLGAIGILVANAATQLGMEVYGYDPFLSVEHAWHLSSARAPLPESWMKSTPSATTSPCTCP